MNLNQNLTPILVETLEQLAREGLIDLRGALEKLFNELMKIEREQAINASPYERSELRKDQSNGFKNKMLQTRVGNLQLSVPQTRNQPFYPMCLEKGERTERAFKLAIAEMYVNGVATRRIKKITEKLCGEELTSSQVSRMAKVMDEELDKFRNRALSSFRFVYLDAHYEKVRFEGVVRSLAVFKAIGVNEQGFREVLGISCGLSEAEVHWKKFLESLLKRGLKGIQLITSDDHSGLKAALNSVLPSVCWQRCIFHLAQNAQNHISKREMKKTIAASVREIYQANSREEAQSRLQKVIDEYEGKENKFCQWLEENFEEGLSFYQFPKELWKKLRTSNSVERMNREIRRRTNVAGLFPSIASCERLVSAVALDIHEDWFTGRKYMTLD